VPGCGLLKYKVTTNNTAKGDKALAEINIVGSTNSNIIRGPPLTFSDTGSSITLSFGFTDDFDLGGLHNFKVEATMADFPEMDNIMSVSDSFEMEVTSDCFKSKMINPNDNKLAATDQATIYHVFDKAFIMERDCLSDTISQVLIDAGSGGPTFYCRKRASTLTVTGFKRTLPEYSYEDKTRPVKDPPSVYIIDTST
jgi:hypothetical protein